MSAPLERRRVLVVGGSGRMGAAVARLAAEAGADVLLVGRSPLELEAVSASLARPARSFVADAHDIGQVRRLVDVYGPVDHLVVALSAGGSTASSIPGTAPAEADRAFRRYRATYNLLHVAPELVGRQGSIVVLSGSSGRRPGAGFGVWSALHGALDALARAAAIELAPVRINVVSPGGVGMRPDRQLAEHYGSPEDVAAAILALMANPAVTGAILDVDGGERLGTWSGSQGELK